MFRALARPGISSRRTYARGGPRNCPAAGSRRPIRVPRGRSADQRLITYRKPFRQIRIMRQNAGTVSQRRDCRNDLQLQLIAQLTQPFSILKVMLWYAVQDIQLVVGQDNTVVSGRFGVAGGWPRPSAGSRSLAGSVASRPAHFQIISRRQLAGHRQPACRQRRQHREPVHFLCLYRPIPKPRRWRSPFVADHQSPFSLTPSGNSSLFPGLMYR